MSEMLLAEIAELEAKKGELQGQFASSTNIAERQSIIDELGLIEKKLTGLRTQQSEVASVGEEAATALFNEFDNITVDDMTFTLRELCLTEGHYQLLSQWLQIREAKKAEEHAAILTSYKSQIDALTDEVESLEFYRKRSIELDDKLADMEARRDAAADELQAAKDEAARLTADNESLRKQVEAKNNPGPTNLNANLAELAKQLQAAKPAITNKRWEDENRKTHYLAELVETGEAIRFGYLEAGKYREVNAEEADRFRSEKLAREAAEAAQEMANQALVEPEVPSYKGEDAEMAEHILDGKMDAEPVTRQEIESRFAALDARISRLEQSAQGRVA